MYKLEKYTTVHHLRKDATKLSKDDVRDIRHLYYHDGVKVNELSKRFCIGGKRTIRILNTKDMTEAGGFVKRKINGGWGESPVSSNRERPLTPPPQKNNELDDFYKIALENQQYFNKVNKDLDDEVLN